MPALPDMFSCLIEGILQLARSLLEQTFSFHTPVPISVNVPMIVLKMPK